MVGIVGSYVSFQESIESSRLVTMFVRSTSRRATLRGGVIMAGSLVKSFETNLNELSSYPTPCRPYFRTVPATTLLFAKGESHLDLP